MWPHTELFHCPVTRTWLRTISTWALAQVAEFFCLEENSENGLRPAVSFLFRSLAEVCGAGSPVWASC